MSVFASEYREVLRTLIAEKGEAVQREERYPYDEYHSVWEDYSTYGWRDYYVSDHLRGETKRVKVPGWEDLPSYRQYRTEVVPGTGCELVIPEGVEVREVNFSEFQDTCSDNREVVGVNAWGGDAESPTTIHCACGKYTGLMIRWEGSLMDAVTALLKIKDKKVTL